MSKTTPDAQERGASIGRETFGLTSTPIPIHQENQEGSTRAESFSVAPMCAFRVFDSSQKGLVALKCSFPDGNGPRLRKESRMKDLQLLVPESGAEAQSHQKARECDARFLNQIMKRLSQ
jgi:hypothetical protein